MAPKKQQKKKEAPKKYDYSDIEKGMKLQAESEGTYYAAEVVQVSTSKSRTKAPIKVNFRGYGSAYDEWVGGDRLRSKALKVVQPEKTEKTAKTPLEFNFGYWKIRGLGAVFRMIFEYKEVKYTDNTYETADPWFKEDKPKILEKNVLANLPYLECGSDCVCQTNAILNYLGNKLRLNGGGYKARMKNDELLCEIYDVRNNMIELAYPFKKVYRDKAEQEEGVKKSLASNPFKKFEDTLEKSGTDYFVGKYPCTSDFHIWEMLDQYSIVAGRTGVTDFWDSIPKCKAFYDRFRALPSLSKYFESEAYKYPINNPIANAYIQ